MMPTGNWREKPLTPCNPTTTSCLFRLCTGVDQPVPFDRYFIRYPQYFARLYFLCHTIDYFLYSALSHFKYDVMPSSDLAIIGARRVLAGDWPPQRSFLRHVIDLHTTMQCSLAQISLDSFGSVMLGSVMFRRRQLSMHVARGFPAMICHQDVAKPHTLASPSSILKFQRHLRPLTPALSTSPTQIWHPFLTKELTMCEQPEVRATRSEGSCRSGSLYSCSRPSRYPPFIDV